MAFMIKNIIDLRGILILMFVIVTSQATNLDCNGKAFRCVNSTHFNICVDLGGISTTIDDVIIPCPEPTVCQNTNRFECEFPVPDAPSETSIVTTVSEVTTETPVITTTFQFDQYFDTVSTTTVPEDVPQVTDALSVEPITQKPNPEHSSVTENVLSILPIHNVTVFQETFNANPTDTSTISINSKIPKSSNETISKNYNVTFTSKNDSIGLQVTALPTFSTDLENSANIKTDTNKFQIIFKTNSAVVNVSSANYSSDVTEQPVTTNFDFNHNIGLNNSVFVHATTVSSDKYKNKEGTTDSTPITTDITGITNNIEAKIKTTIEKQSNITNIQTTFPKSYIDFEIVAEVITESTNNTQGKINQTLENEHKITGIETTNYPTIINLKNITFDTIGSANNTQEKNIQTIEKKNTTTETDTTISPTTFIDFEHVSIDNINSTNNNQAKINQTLQNELSISRQPIKTSPTAYTDFENGTVDNIRVTQPFTEVPELLQNETFLNDSATNITVFVDAVNPPVLEAKTNVDVNSTIRSETTTVMEIIDTTQLEILTDKEPNTNVTAVLENINSSTTFNNTTEFSTPTIADEVNVLGEEINKENQTIIYKKASSTTTASIVVLTTQMLVGYDKNLESVDTYIPNTTENILPVTESKAEIFISISDAPTKLDDTKMAATNTSDAIENINTANIRQKLGIADIQLRDDTVKAAQINDAPIIDPMRIVTNETIKSNLTRDGRKIPSENDAVNYLNHSDTTTKNPNSLEAVNNMTSALQEKSNVSNLINEQYEISTESTAIYRSTSVEIMSPTSYVETTTTKTFFTQEETPTYTTSDTARIPKAQSNKISTSDSVTDLNYINLNKSSKGSENLQLNETLDSDSTTIVIASLIPEIANDSIINLELSSKPDESKSTQINTMPPDNSFTTTAGIHTFESLNLETPVLEPSNTYFINDSQSDAESIDFINPMKELGGNSTGKLVMKDQAFRVDYTEKPTTIVPDSDIIRNGSTVTSATVKTNGIVNPTNDTTMTKPGILAKLAYVKIPSATDKLTMLIRNETNANISKVEIITNIENEILSDTINNVTLSETTTLSLPVITEQSTVILTESIQVIPVTSTSTPSASTIITETFMPTEYIATDSQNQSNLNESQATNQIISPNINQANHNKITSMDINSGKLENVTQDRNITQIESQSMNSDSVAQQHVANVLEGSLVAQDQSLNINVMESADKFISTPINLSDKEPIYITTNTPIVLYLNTESQQQSKTSTVTSTDNKLSGNTDYLRKDFTSAIITTQGPITVTSEKELTKPFMDNLKYLSISENIKHKLTSSHPITTPITNSEDPLGRAIDEHVALTSTHIAADNLEHPSGAEIPSLSTPITEKQRAPVISSTDTMLATHEYPPTTLLAFDDTGRTDIPIVKEVNSATEEISKNIYISENTLPSVSSEKVSYSTSNDTIAEIDFSKNTISNITHIDTTTKNPETTLLNPISVDPISYLEVTDKSKIVNTEVTMTIDSMVKVSANLSQTKSPDNSEIINIKKQNTTSTFTSISPQPVLSTTYSQLDTQSIATTNATTATSDNDKVTTETLLTTNIVHRYRTNVSENTSSIFKDMSVYNVAKNQSVLENKTMDGYNAKSTIANHTISVGIDYVRSISASRDELTKTNTSSKINRDIFKNSIPTLINKSITELALNPSKNLSPKSEFSLSSHTGDLLLQISNSPATIIQTTEKGIEQTIKISSANASSVPNKATPLEMPADTILPKPIKQTVISVSTSKRSVPVNQNTSLKEQVTEMPTNSKAQQNFPALKRKPNINAQVAIDKQNTDPFKSNAGLGNIPIRTDIAKVNSIAGIINKGTLPTNSSNTMNSTTVKTYTIKNTKTFNNSNLMKESVRIRTPDQIVKTTTFTDVQNKLVETTTLPTPVVTDQSTIISTEQIKAKPVPFTSLPLISTVINETTDQIVKTTTNINFKPVLDVNPSDFENITPITNSDVLVIKSIESENTHSGIISSVQSIIKNTEAKKSAKSENKDGPEEDAYSGKVKDDQENKRKLINVELTSLQNKITPLTHTIVATEKENKIKMLRDNSTKEELITTDHNYFYPKSTNYSSPNNIQSDTNTSVSGYRNETPTHDPLKNSTPRNDSHTSNIKSQDQNISIPQTRNTTVISKDQSTSSGNMSHTKSTAVNTQSTAFPALESTTRKTNISAFSCGNKRGKFSDQNDCRKFYICQGNDKAVQKACPVNTVFSEINKQCTKNLSHCIRNNQFRCVAEGRFSDFLNDNVYYICVKNNPSHFIRFKLLCQNGYRLNKTSVRCVLNKESTSTSENSKSVSEQNYSSGKNETPETKESPENTKKFKCKEEGLFPDPSNCGRYFVCTERDNSSYRQKRKKCDSGEVFHKDKKKCIDSESYEC